MSTIRSWLGRVTCTRKGGWSVAVLAFALACSAPSVFGVLRSPGRPQAHPAVRTNKSGYLAGEPIAISGEGFPPFDNVSLLVSHAGGGAESGAGHERFFVTADANGAFKAQWSVRSDDIAGTNFVVAATVSSGSTAQAKFSRSGTISIEAPAHRAGDIARVVAEGFNPNELVTFKVNGSEHARVTELSDANGRVTAELALPSDNAAATSFNIEAAASDSAMVLTLAMTTSDFFVVTDQLSNGQPSINDTPGQSDLTQMGRLDSGSTYDIFMSWDSTDLWTGSGATGDACALFDTDGDSAGNIDFAVCGQITNQNGNPGIVVQTAASPFVFTCGNKKNDRCTTPAPYGTAATTAANVKSGTLADLTRDGNLITATDPFAAGSNSPNDATLRIQIVKSYLPTNAKLVNLCSYPSAGSGGNNNPFDCIVPPGGNGFIKVDKNAPGADSQTTFTFNISGGVTSLTRQVNAGTGWTTNGIAFPIGTYSVTETNIPTNWSFGNASCGASQDSGTPAVSGIAVTVGSVTTCTFNNNGQPHLTLSNNVINNNGGTATADMWTLNAACSTSATCGTANQSGVGGFSKNVSPGSYALSQTGGAPGYTTGPWSCTGGTVSGNTVTLGYGQNVTCSITDDDQPGTLIVKKVVDNTSGGTKTATAFSFQVNSGPATAFLQAGANPLAGSNTLTLNAGTYTITEPAVAGYTTSYSNCANLLLANGGSGTCTITNTSQKASPSVTAVQSWVLRNTATVKVIRTGGSGGSVKFELYSNNTCGAGALLGSETASITVDSAGAGVASTATGVKVTVPGTYYWIIRYSGDQYNNAYNTNCGDETTTIAAKNIP